MLSLMTGFLLLAAAPAPAGLPLLPTSTYLIRGKVIDAQQTRGTLTKNKICIDHVYHGPKDLIAQTLVTYSADSLTGNATNVVVPSLRVGEIAIWLLVRSSGGLSPEGWYNCVRWPIRETNGLGSAPSYETIEALAETLERVSELSREDQATAALKHLATDANPYISSWAISRLPAVSQGATEVLDFLTGLVNDEHLPIQGQVALDAVLQGQADIEGILIERPSPRWQNSEARLNLFRRWMAGALSKRDAALVITRLDHTAQHPTLIGFPQDDLMRLVTLLVTNDKFPLAERQRGSTIIMWAARRYDSDDVTFNTAVDLVSSDLTDQLREAVAAVFVNEFVLNEDRRQILTKLRDGESAKSIIRLLDKALARPNGKPRRPFVFRGGSKRREPFTGRTADDDAE